MYNHWLSVIIAFAISMSSLMADKPVAAQDTTLADLLVDGQNWELVAEGFKFVKGLAFDDQGTLYFSDLTGNKIYRLGADGKPEVFVANSAATNGLSFGPDGRLYGCQMETKRIVAYDKSGAAHDVYRGEFAASDLVVKRDGGLYFTAAESRVVQYVSPQGQAKLADRETGVNDGIARPTGIALWPAQGTLVVADALSAQLWAFRIESDGSLAHKAPFYQLQTPPGHAASGADGMTVDAQGRLYVATYVGIQVFDTQGRLSGVISNPTSAFASNVKFGGAKLDTLYVASSDKIFRRKMKVSGVR
jgi:sugar lactone lactonase YvrE